MGEEAKNAAQGPRTTLEQLMAKARLAKASADPHIRRLAQKAKQAADAAQRNAAEYRPELDRQVRAGASRARDAFEAAKPRVEHIVEEARPRVERAARQAADYVVEHQDELREAAREAAELITPTTLRPVVRKMTEKIVDPERRTTAPTEPSETRGK